MAVKTQEKGRESREGTIKYQRTEEPVHILYLVCITYVQVPSILPSKNVICQR